MMKVPFTTIPGSITAPQGFLAAGLFCDIKRLGTGKGSDKGQKRDLGLILSEIPASAAGLFTTNQVCAAPVRLCMEHIVQGQAQAIAVNSGNANACTGAQGMQDARVMAQVVANQFHMPANHVLVASTGRIGVKLPMANVKQGLAQAAGLLGNGPEHATEVAEAIMTSDTRPKQIAVEFELSRKRVRLGGICKGAGMIQPGMSPTGRRPASTPWHATMLCFLTTDAAVRAPVLQWALTGAVAQSFNRITVDGDMSTNDTVLILANGLAGNPLLEAPVEPEGEGKSKSGSGGLPKAGSKDYDRFQRALNYVCLELAKMIVRDGEGVSRFVTVRVLGARSFEEADAAARAVANSALVKTSWFGGDPNWGRILDALGYSAAEVDERKVDLGYSVPARRKVVYALRRGQPTRVSFEALCELVAEKEFDLHIHLNLGAAAAVIYASDLTEEYVDFNKGDLSNPAALGG